MNVNQAAFCTTTVLAVATVGCVLASAASVSAVASLAFGTLAVTLACVSIAAVAAWVQKAESKQVRDYFDATYHHSGHTIAGGFQFVAQTLVQRLIFQGSGAIVNRITSR